MNKKQKADTYCSIGIVSFLICLLFIVILAASTAKMDITLQTIGGILAAIAFVVALVFIIKSIKIYDGKEE